jgi:hypothetical protein
MLKPAFGASMIPAMLTRREVNGLRTLLALSQDRADSPSVTNNDHAMPAFCGRGRSTLRVCREYPRRHILLASGVRTVAALARHDLVIPHVATFLG